MMQQSYFDRWCNVLAIKVGVGVAELPDQRSLRIEYFGQKMNLSEYDLIFDSQELKIQLKM